MVIYIWKSTGEQQENVRMPIVTVREMEATSGTSKVNLQYLKVAKIP